MMTTTMFGNHPWRLALLVTTMVASLQVQADVLSLNYAATMSADGLSVVNTTVNSIVNTPALTSQNSYSHALPTLNYPLTGSITVANPTGFEFYDDYVFTVAGSSVSSITATIDLGNLFNIDNLNVRLFSWNNTDEQINHTVTIGTTAPNTIQAWTYPTGTGEVAVIDQTNLAAGTYVLQVRGNVSGTAGGSYVGTLNVAPVPLPAALPLLFTGCGLLSGFYRRRQTNASAA